MRNQDMARLTPSSYSVAEHRVLDEVSPGEDGVADHDSPHDRLCVAAGHTYWTPRGGSRDFGPAGQSASQRSVEVARSSARVMSSCADGIRMTNGVIQVQ